MLPIAQAQEHDGVDLLAFALEIYRTGFAVTLQAQSHGAIPFVDAAPSVTLDLTDDCGGRYTSQPYGAAGEGARNDWQWRLACRCTSALDPQARTLRLAIEALAWSRPDPVRERFDPVRTVRGPRVFVIVLPALGDEPAS